MRHYVLFVVALLGTALLFLEDLSTAANVLLLAATSAAGLFSLAYAVRSKWRATMPGRALLYSSLAFFTLGVQASLSIWVGSEYGGWGAIRFSLYLVLALTSINMLLTLLHVQREAHRP